MSMSDGLGANSNLEVVDCVQAGSFSRIVHHPFHNGSDLGFIRESVLREPQRILFKGADIGTHS